MSITSENVIFIYRQGDSDSYEVALAYQELHNLYNSQLVGISCSDEEVLQNRELFLEQVEYPIFNAINSIENGYTEISNVFCVVLGYNVPAGFRDGENIISSTSRIARIKHNYSPRERNPLYDRKVYKSYDADDASKVLITGRIDGKNKDVVLELINKTKTAINQRYINGAFFFDAYSDKLSDDAQTYFEDLKNFENFIIEDLNLNNILTKFEDSYVDVFHPFVKDDSFYWGWFTDRGDSTFFTKTSTSRIFFYNADFDGGYSIKEEESSRWPQVSIENGYIATAGAMSNPRFDGLLRPTPFFEALYNGATLGEAYLYSNPYIDWTISFIGDPLAVIAFPGQYDGVVSDEILDEQWIETITNVSRLQAHQYNIDNELLYMRQLLVESDDVATTVDLLHLVDALYQSNTYSIDDNTNEVINSLATYASAIRAQRQNISLSEYIVDNNFYISNLTASRMGGNVPNTNKLEEGYWEIIFTIEKETEDFVIYSFDIEVSDDEFFSNILYNSSSNITEDGWFYEFDTNAYVPLDRSGIGSNFTGMKIKYKSLPSQYLTRGKIYYFRTRQKTNMETFSFTNISDVIYS